MTSMKTNDTNVALGNNDAAKQTIFEAATYDEKYWKTYIEARPQYSLSFYDTVFKYHRRYCIDPVSTLAVDVGSGPGQVAEVLADHFPEVVVSDVYNTHLQAAHVRLRDLVRKNQVKLVLSGGETLHEHVSPASVDLVTVAECMPLMDTRAAIASFHKILKPGGTLAIWFYGRPAFVSPDGTEGLDTACNQAYHRLINKAFGLQMPLDFTKNPSSRGAWQNALNCLYSYLDDVEIPDDQFSHITRMYVNRDADLTLFGPDLPGLTPQYTPRIGKNEKHEAFIDRTWWSQDWGIEDVKKFVSIHLPSFEAGCLAKDELRQELKDMEDAIGGHGAKKQVTWPLVSILATKK